MKALEGAGAGAGDARDDEGGVLLELMVTPEAARLEAKLGGKAEESLDEAGDADNDDLLLELAGVIVTPLVDLPAKMALVSMTVTLSRSALDFAADEAKAWSCLGSSMVTTCKEVKIQKIAKFEF